VLTPADYHDTLVAIWLHGSARSASPSLHITHWATADRVTRLQSLVGPIFHRHARNYAPAIFNDLGLCFIYETVVASNGLKPGPALVARLQGGVTFEHESDH